MKRPHVEPEFRTIRINDKQTVHFTSNSVTTAKYNFFTFVPLFLFNQFRSYSNVFFLIVSIVQQLPGVSPMGRYTTVVPLIIILIVTAVKELIEDVTRHRADRQINGRNTLIWRDDIGWTPVQWKHVEVGQLAKVTNDLEFPADLVLIGSSKRTNGLAYVETVNLDGESNLKIRRTAFSLNFDEKTAATLRGKIGCDRPNEFIDNFNGVIIRQQTDSEISINEEQLLLRGAILRNTDWIIGVVVYTGTDTKIRRNSQRRSAKRSTVADTINWHMMVLFTAFFLLTVSNSVLFVLWNFREHEYVWYLPFNSIITAAADQPATKTNDLNICTFLTFAVGYSFIIPISLQIYLEISHLIQARYIDTDDGMRDATSGRYAKTRTSNLNSDLGRVSYVFTDKTGTLTRNVLKFKECSIGGVIYRDEEDANILIEQCKQFGECHHFFVALCVAPGIIPVKDDATNTIKYYSSSTDLMALITAAKNYGYELRHRTYRIAEIAVHGTIQRYEILSDIDFTSNRRRSTVIVKTPENRIILYIMGSDDVIFKRIKSNTVYIKETTKHIVAFAISGLRTLCVAMAELNEIDYRRWRESFVRAKLTLNARQSFIEKVADKIETNLTLLGAVACEDKLQDRVPETISILTAAGIKIWMLTGDKRETATAIGYSTKLLTEQSTIFALDSNDIDRLRESCVQISRKIKKTRRSALIVNGVSLKTLLDSNYAEYFTTLSLNCETVICYRMIPIQKARIINYVQNRTKRVTLAIGDGANDVAMIQTATVGVGISGVEGLQAVHAADYSIAVFEHLSRLLLVHGTWNYNRVCKLIYYSYYKNLPIALIVFYVSYASGWSGASVFDDWAFTLYNVIFTDGATLAIGALDENYPQEVLVRYPAIYRHNTWLDATTFYLCLFNGLIHTIFVLFLTIRVCQTNVLWHNSYNDSYIIQGNILYTNVLVLVIMKCLLHLMRWTTNTILLIVFTAIIWIPVLYAYDFMAATWLAPNSDVVGVAGMLFATPVFWLNVVLVPFTTLLIDSIAVIVYRTFWMSANIEQSVEYKI